MLESVVVVLIVVLLLCWLVSIIPIPSGDFPIKTILYVLIILIGVLRILGYV